MGDFQANFKRPETGIQTVEGNVAGSRAAMLEKKRQRDQETFEARKRQIQTTGQHAPMALKFAEGSTGVEEKSFKELTVGLVTAEAFKKLAQEAENPSVSKTDPAVAAAETALAQAVREKAERKARKKRLKEKRKIMSTLSFANEEDEGGMWQDEQDGEGDAVGTTKLVSRKNPSVNTAFLPDKARDEQAQTERRRLEKEWETRQEQTKQEKLEITYSYWDGSGHRRVVECRKGDTIGDFLERVRVDLCREFRELTSIAADALVYVKEDLIIPQDLTFYDLILTKARGKSGPLFHFDVHDDVRIGAIDARVEKDESHPGKVVERRWYERNKHIFPASRWELYDPSKEYGNYTIGDKRSRNNKT
jgi:protein FAM50